MRTKSLFFLAVLPVLAACEPPAAFTDTPGVREAFAREVVDCTPLTILTTTLGVSGTLGRKKALELARNETKAKAAEAGADTIVFESGTAPDDLFVRAASYQCG